jgi:hypothetical protein
MSPTVEHRRLQPKLVTRLDLLFSSVVLLWFLHALSTVSQRLSALSTSSWSGTPFRCSSFHPQGGCPF